MRAAIYIIISKPTSYGVGFCYFALPHNRAISLFTKYIFNSIMELLNIKRFEKH